MKLIASNQLTLTNVNDGKSSYTHIAYAYSADGTDRFSLVYPNLNLLEGTKDFSGTWNRTGGWINDGIYKGLTVKKFTGQWNGINKIFTAPKDGTYTFSAYIKSSGNAADIMRYSSIGEVTKYIGNNFDWIRDSVTVNLKANDVVWIRYEISTANTGSILWTAGHKWEESSVATPWMPSKSEATTADWPSYIGQYTDHTPESSTDPTKYEWFLTKGNDGKDGQTPYIHWAYSDNADGTGLTTSDNGQRYIGNYSDYTQADSTDKTKYKWADRWAKIKVDGRNLAQKTSKDWSNPYTSFSGVQNTCINLYKVLIDGLSVGDTLKSRIVLKYTSIIPASGKTATIWLQGNGDVTGWNAGAYNGSPAKPISGSGEMVFEHEFKITADHLKNNNWNWQFRTDYIASGSLQWRLAKVENGTVFTGWSPALEDTQEQIDSKADQTLTQDQLNALAEKNNLIKAEMEAKASIDTVNQWITAYQNYVNANDADKAKSEQALKDASERILAIRYEVNDLQYVWDAIDTYMSFQNEGLIIGKKDGSAYAKFSDDRISLFSGSSEVMYISQGTLNIANGIFTKTIQIGRFRFETHPADADMLVIRFVGG